MRKLLKSHHPMRHANSFKYAFQGVFHALLNEANFRVQILVALIYSGLGFYFNVSGFEWALITIVLGFLLCAEIINTAIEEFIDHLIKEHHEGAKTIKNLSAGFVLVASMTALIVGVIIFSSRILNLFG